jgi:hypothetical protein
MQYVVLINNGYLPQHVQIQLFDGLVTIINEIVVRL